MNLLRTTLFVFLSASIALAIPRQKIQGNCEKGNEVVVTPGSQNSTTKVQRSYPSCTVTIYDAGTLNLSTIYSDDAGTAKANPFTAATDGSWFFYANDGRYDVKMSGAGISAPFTRGDYQALDYRFQGIRINMGRVTLDNNYSVDWGVPPSERIAGDTTQHVITIWPNLVDTTQFWQDKTDSIVPMLFHAGSRPYNTSTGSQVVFCCDSLTEGWTGFVNYDWVSNITVYSWVKLNKAIGGTTAYAWLLSASSVAGQPNSYTLIDSNLAPFAQFNVAVIWAGTNDLYGHFATGAELLAYIAAWARDRRRQGWKVVVTTLQAMSDATAESERLLFNTAIKAQWPLFADALVDIAAHAEIGAPGAASDPTYFPDGKHLSQAGYDLVWPDMQTELLKIANSQQMPVFNTLVTGTVALTLPNQNIEMTDNYKMKWGAGNYFICNAASNYCAIWSNGVERVRVDSSGDVTIAGFTGATNAGMYVDSFGVLHRSAVGPPLNVTKTVKGSDGANCNLVFTDGILTSTTCP